METLQEGRGGRNQAEVSISISEISGQEIIKRARTCSKACKLHYMPRID